MPMDEHVPISVWSRFGEDSDIYKRMSAKSLLIPGTPWMDFFNPAGQKTFWAELKTGIFDYGLDGWWMDASEPEFDILKGHQTFLGSGESVRNAYPLYVTKAIYEGQRSTTDRKRVVIFTRSAIPGQQRNAAISWSGDISANWITFQRQIPAGLNFSMAGLPYWTTDGGGFFRPKDQYTNEAYHELLTRWFQYARILSDLPRARMDFECRDLELRSEVPETSPPSTMSCVIICCLTFTLPHGASPARVKP